jgi:hypothetical protein
MITGVAHSGATWFTDPWGVIFILVEKTKPGRPCFAQF